MPRPSAQPSARMLSTLRRGAAAIVVDVAQAVIAAQSRLRPAAIRRKGVGDFVTAVDVRTERRLRRDLGKLLPEAGFLGEESAASGLDREYVWVVDPIDGTSNFANNLAHFAVAVALLHRSRPVLATMWCQPDGQLFEAVRGRGAFRAGRRVRGGRGRWDDGSIVGMQWHRGRQDLDFVKRISGHGARVRTFGCTVTQVVDTALGRLDANIQQQGRIWDIVAPGLFLEEAGGRFTDWAGKSVFPLPDLLVEHTATVGAMPGVHRKILPLLPS